MGLRVSSWSYQDLHLERYYSTSQPIDHSVEIGKAPGAGNKEILRFKLDMNSILGHSNFSGSWCVMARLTSIGTICLLGVPWSNIGSYIIMLSAPSLSLLSRVFYSGSSWNPINSWFLIDIAEQVDNMMLLGVHIQIDVFLMFIDRLPIYIYPGGVY